MVLRSTLLCFAGFFVHGFGSWAVNSGYYPQVGLYFPEAREIATICAMVFYVLLGAAARYRPRLFDARILVGLCLACSVFGCLILELALQTQSPFETLVAMIVRVFTKSLAIVLLGAALCSLGSAAKAAAVGLGASVLCAMVTAVLPEIDGATEAVVAFGVLAASSVLAYFPAKPLLETVSKGDAPVDLELSNPNSFISWRSGLYVCILLFSVITGVSFTFSSWASGLRAGLAMAAIGFGVVVWFLAGKGSRKEDTLFGLAAVMAVAGLAFMPIDSAFAEMMSHVMSDAATNLFMVLIWLLIYSVAAKSVYAMLPTLCAAWAVQSAGVLLGAGMGHRLNSDVLSIPEFSAVALVGLFAWLWFGFRSFSFHGTVEALTSFTAEDSAKVSQGAGKSGLERACENLGARFGLTKRETEIFGLLAHGRNSRYIQDFYCVSRNTAKTHIKNIYAKLDVHSHQELIDLVESFEDAGV